MPKVKAVSRPVASRIVDSGRETHTRNVAGQQAFAEFDLNFGIDRYLPEKLKHPGKSLP